MVWITSSAASLTRYTQVGSSMVSIMMSSINPSIEDYFSLVSTFSVSAGTIFVYSVSYYYWVLSACVVVGYMLHPMMCT